MANEFDDDWDDFDEPQSNTALDQPSDKSAKAAKKNKKTSTNSSDPGGGRVTGIVGVIIGVLVIAGVIAAGLYIANPKSTTATPGASGATDEPVADLFKEPPSLKTTIDTVRESTVTISCGSKGGSGWYVALKDNPDTTADDLMPYEIVTNEHVIDECASGGEILFAVNGSTVVREAKLFAYDKDEDLAILLTDFAAPSLPVAPVERKPQIGQWVMAVGSPGSGYKDLTGTVTTGRVTNLDGYAVVFDAALNGGNSGGPLINSNGEVIGTNTATDLTATQNTNYANANPALCARLVKCDDVNWNWR